MKAVIYKKYGASDVLEIVEIPKPTPKDDEVLIKVIASTVSSADWRARSLELPAGMGFLGRLIFGIFKPRKPILGTELSGIIEAIGKDVTKFKVGDEVFAFPGVDLGCHAQYRVMGQDGRVVYKPVNLSFEEAAALSFGGTTAFNFLRDRGKIKAGEKALIIGASGCVGSAAVQIAKSFGAEVDGVCSTKNVDLVKSLGADRVIDYTKEDFRNNSQTYDVIFNANGIISFAGLEKSLNKNARILLVLSSFKQMLGLEKMSKQRDIKIISGVAPERVEDLLYLSKLAQESKFKPVVEKIFPLEEIAKAHDLVDSGRKRGSVVIRMFSE